MELVISTVGVRIFPLQTLMSILNQAGIVAL